MRSLRDVALEAYTAVRLNVVEAKVAAQVQGTRIRVAVAAVVPESPVAPRRVMNIGIALVLGLIAGVFAAFGVEYLRKTGEKPEEEE